MRDVPDFLANTCLSCHETGLKHGMRDGQYSCADGQVFVYSNPDPDLQAGSRGMSLLEVFERYLSPELVDRIATRVCDMLESRAEERRQAEAKERAEEERRARGEELMRRAGLKTSVFLPHAPGPSTFTCDICLTVSAPHHSCDCGRNRRRE